MADDIWPSLYEYALAHQCTTCGAEPGSDCNAPRKKARVARANQLMERFGQPPVEHNSVRLLHATRSDAGSRHRTRDIGNAPDKEDRVPGRRYDSVDETPSRRSAATTGIYGTVAADPADVGRRDATLRYETEIVWTENFQRLDYVRETLDTSAGTRFRPLPWNGPGQRVGYSTLAADAPNNGSPGRFTRRIFWVKDSDRSAQPDGTYRTTAPTEAVDPRTVRPGVMGELTERAWGKPLHHNDQ
ncbi:DUF6009 family protein [Streptomyces sp. NPDC058391]|uniref:DUF6009 family protein n=1 Tax=Streptomyces sp. NPDC058391 TaxID=3346476 RepID=UPI003662262D